MLFVLACEKAESSDEPAKGSESESAAAGAGNNESEVGADEASDGSDLLSTKIEVDGSDIEATFDGEPVEIKSATVVLAKNVAISKDDPLTWRRVQLWTKPVTCEEAKKSLPKLPEEGRDYVKFEFQMGKVAVENGEGTLYNNTTGFGGGMMGGEGGNLDFSKVDTKPGAKTTIQIDADYKGDEDLNAPPFTVHGKVEVYGCGERGW